MPSVPLNMSTAHFHVNEPTIVAVTGIALQASCSDFKCGVIQVSPQVGQILPTAGAVQFEGTLDRITWFPLPVYPVSTAIRSLQAIPVIANNLFYFLAEVTDIRMRVTTIITAPPVGSYITVYFHEDVLSPFGSDAPGTALLSAAVSGSISRVGGKVTTGVDLTLLNNDASDFNMTTSGALINHPFAPPEQQFTVTSVRTDAADFPLRVATASVRAYLTGLQLQNTSATASVIQIKDGATVIWSASLPASMATPVNIDFAVPIRTTANTALNFACLTTGTNTFVNAQGFMAV
jgi:hypothetical protein